MRRISVLIICCAIATVTYAQTFDEWFNQKETQRKYLLQQITALQIYVQYLEKGYSIAKDGLATINNAKQGEFMLHKSYLSSLDKASPAVRNNAKVADIITLQSKVMEIYNDTYAKIRDSGVFTNPEVSYISRVYDRLLSDCDNTLNGLLQVTTDGMLEMREDERFKQIDTLYFNMTQHYTFIKNFSNEAMVLATSRIKENNDIETSRILNGIK